MRSALLSCMLLPPLAGGPPPARSTLPAVELAFAHRGQAVGYQQAFLEHFAENCVVLRPRAVNARAFYAKAPRDPGQLRWYPSWCRVSADGAFGFSSGPYQYTPEGGRPPAHGHFVTVWRKSGDRWEALLDAGAPHPAPPLLELPAQEAEPSRPPGKGAPGPEGLDEAFSADAAQGGVAAAFAARGGGTRFIRSGQQPSASLTQAELEGLKGHRWVREGGGAAASGDLAFSFGTRQDGSGKALAAFARFWRLEGKVWKLDLDLELPLD
ncbi:MAG: hypothetical protein HY823_02335 [Acidobacteria bacterium]|nr:hypothetical protein [Acidobacteriota bacterium]